MAISLTCPCGKKLKVPEQLAGKRIKCPVCQAAIAVTAPTPDPQPTSGDGPQELNLVTARAFSAPVSKPSAKKAKGGSSARSKALVACSRCTQSFPPDQVVKWRGQMICRPCKEELLIERPSSAESARKVLMYSMIFSVVGLLIVAGLGVFLLIRLASKPSPKKPPTKAEEVVVADSGTQPVAAGKSGERTSGEANREAPATEKTAQPTVPPAAPKSEPEPQWRPLRHEPPSGKRWRFELEAFLGLSGDDGAAEGNRLTGVFDLEQTERTPLRQDLSLLFRQLQVAKPFSDEDYRGSAAFPGNVLGKKMTLRLGQKAAEQVPPGVPPELPGILEDGEIIVHDDDSRDPAGKAFQRYLTRQGNDLLAQAFLFLGRDLLPKELGTGKTWEVVRPLFFDAGVYAPVTWTMTRQMSPEEHVAQIAIKTRTEHMFKQEGKPSYQFKVNGQGTWSYNLDDSMTEKVEYQATVEEEQLPDRIRHRYVVRLRLQRLAWTDEPLPMKSEPVTPKPEPDKPEAKPEKPDPAPDDKPTPEPKGDKPAAEKPGADAKAPVPAEQQERLAQSKLKQVRQFIELGKTDDAIDYCEQILKRWPGTNAAREAAELLKKLKR